MIGSRRWYPFMRMSLGYRYHGYIVPGRCNILTLVLGRHVRDTTWTAYILTSPLILDGFLYWKRMFDNVLIDDGNQHSHDQYRLPMAEQVRCGTPCLSWSLGVREVVGSRSVRGNYKESFSSNLETGKVFSPEIRKF